MIVIDTSPIELELIEDLLWRGVSIAEIAGRSTRMNVSENHARMKIPVCASTLVTLQELCICVNKLAPIRAVLC